MYGLRIYDQYDHWWVVNTIDDLALVLLDTVDKLQKYGVFWLENPLSTNLWETPISWQGQFRDLLIDIASPNLARVGYEMMEYNDETVFPYYLKRLSEGLFAFIEFQMYTTFSASKLEFDVHLQRKPTILPGDFTQGYQLNVPLWLLLVTTYGFDSQLWSRKKWEFSSRSQLKKQLREAMLYIETYAISWLDDPTSTMKPMLF